MRKLKRQARLWEEGDIERLSDFTAGQRRALEDEERARLQKQIDLDASTTTQRTFLGSIVTFGAGLQVLGFITGFEACLVRVSGLPVDASDKEIFALFTQQGGTAVDQARLYLAHNKVLPNGTRDVRMVMDIEWGRALSAGLQGIEFRDHRLSFRIHPYKPPGGMSSRVREAFISWRAISTCYVVSYSSEAPIDIDQKVKQLNGYTCFGRRLRAERLAPPPGHPPDIALESLRIENLPTFITYAEVFNLAGPHASSVRATPSAPGDLEIIRSALSSSGCVASDIISLEPVSITDGALEGMSQFCARFSSEDIVTRVYDYLNGRTLLGGLFFDVSFSAPKYAIAIPAEQYAAQLSQWVELKHSMRGYDKTQCSLVKLRIPETSIVRLTVTGTDPQAVGAIKIRAEALAAGERLVGWHDQLRERSNSAFVSGVMAKSGAYVRVDRHLRQINLYGSPQAISSARTMITDEIARLSTRPSTIEVPVASVQSFVARGLPELRELLGSENVHFDPAANVLVTSGGYENQYISTRITSEASCIKAILPFPSSVICPVCFDVVNAPGVKLGCGHTYCTSCLRRLIMHALDSPETSLSCLGNKGHCNVPIAIPLIERFLHPPMFKRLLEKAFALYVAQHPTELRNCPTPGCEKLYRVCAPDDPQPEPIQCPGCLSVLCPACHLEGHGTRSCKENRLLRDPVEQERVFDEWMHAQSGDVKRCPQCRIPIYKAEGCHHVECAGCGTHICWFCLAMSDDGRVIYMHMSLVHDD